MEHDPFISSASPINLIRIVDANFNASQLERRLCELLEHYTRDTSSQFVDAERRAEDAEGRVGKLEGILEDARDDLQKIIDRLDMFL